MPLSRRSVGTYQETNSHATCQGTLGHSCQLAEPLWIDPGLKSGISVCELISTLKKKAQAGNELSNILPKPSHTRGSHHHHQWNWKLLKEYYMV